MIIDDIIDYFTKDLSDVKASRILGKDPWQEELPVIDSAYEDEIRERCGNSFKHFAEYCWSILNSAPLIQNIAFDAICEHLQAVSEGQIKRLVINLPFKFCKSILCSVLFPAWEWIRWPWMQYLSISYITRIPRKDNQRTRQVVISPIYQHIWGDTVELDEASTIKISTKAGGYKVTTSSQSEFGIGDGGHKIIYDDPHNPMDAFNTEAIKKTINQYKQVIASRIHPGTDKDAIILIMQKICKGDLSDYFLYEVGGFDHLCLPMEYDPGRIIQPTKIGFVDPRTEKNELLSPELVPPDRVEELKKQLGPFGVSTQLQQQSSELLGAVVDVNEFVRYTELPPVEEWRHVFQSWDTAQNDNELINSPWVGGTWLVTDELCYLIHVYRQWHKYPDGKIFIINHWRFPPYDTFIFKNFRNPSRVLIENKSTGASLLQEIPLVEPLMAGLLIPVDPHGSKVQRMYEQNALIRAGRIAIPENAEWLYTFLAEISAFPATENKDQTDMLSQSLYYISWMDQILGGQMQNSEVIYFD